MTPAIRELFERLMDGLAIIAPDGKVRFANESLRNMLPILVGQPFPDTAVLHQLQSALAGHLPIPHSFQTELRYGGPLSEPDEAMVHILKSPAGNDLVVVVRNLTEAHFYDTALENFSSLVDNHYRQPLDDFAVNLDELLAAIEANNADATQLRDKRTSVLEQGKALLEQLAQLSSLAAVSRGKALVTDDRIVATEWLPQVVAMHEERARQRGQRLVATHSDETLPVLYGSVFWLTQALSACIDNAIKHSPERTDIEIDLRQAGGFLRIMIRNTGTGALSPAQRTRLLKPLHQGPRTHTNDVPGLGLGLPLARRIVELHRGHLALEQDLDDTIVCHIELPTGGLPLDARAADVEQAQRYARDLARLMQRQAAARESN